MALYNVVLPILTLFWWMTTWTITSLAIEYHKMMMYNGYVHCYCGWLNFRGVPIFVVFVEGSTHEFQYPRNGDFLYELWREILCPRILNPSSERVLSNPRKLVPTKIKPSTVFQCDTCPPKQSHCLWYTFFINQERVLGWEVLTLLRHCGACTVCILILVQPNVSGHRWKIEDMCLIAQSGISASAWFSVTINYCQTY